MYIPPKDFTPLLFIESDENEDSIHANNNLNAFIIPQTGGVVVYNRNSNESLSHLSTEMIHNSIEIFISQIREIFGFIPLDDFSQLNEKSILILPSSSGISDWELDQLLRERTFENLLLATTNLQSLSEMVQKLTIMMISDEIQETVFTALNAIKTVCFFFFFFITTSLILIFYLFLVS